MELTPSDALRTLSVEDTVGQPPVAAPARRPSFTDRQRVAAEADPTLN